MHLCHMYSRMYINAYTITRGLVIFHVGKCVKDVRTGLQNTSSCFVDEAISLSLSPLLSSPLIRALLLPLAFSNRRGSPVFFLLLLLPLLCPPLPPSPRSFFFLLSFPCFARLGSVSSPQGFLRRHRRRYGRFRFRRRDEEV